MSPNPAPVGDPGRERRRVLTVVDSLRRGGAARTLIALQGRLSRRRFDLRVVSLLEPSDLAAELREMKVAVHELGLSGHRDLLKGTVKLRRLVSTMEIDLVHTYTSFGGVVGRLAAAGKAPVVSTLPDPRESDGGFRRERWLISSLDRVTARRLTRKLVVMSRTAEEQHARLGMGGTEVVQGCLDVEAFRTRVTRHDRGHVRTAYGLAPTEVVFLHVGRFHAHRGQDVLLRAFRVALREQPGLRLLLAGEGQTLPQARVLAEELDLKDAVEFLGEVADVAALYRAADVFVLPSRYEAFATALLEAMAAGLPAVVDDGGDVSEVSTEATAIFADVRREEELARGMLTLARDAQLRRRLGEGAGRRASAFDVSRSVERLEAIYDKLA